jgi:hypothetical protein
MLAYSLQNLRNAGIKIVITPHTITAMPGVYEQFAHGFVSLSRAGAEVLRHRVDRPVEWIDHLCPRWRESARIPREGEFVVGAHGFLWYDKGFFEVVDALRGREDTTFLLYSHPRHPDIEREFERHIAGTRTTWVKDHLPLDEIIDSLSTRADVLVCWRKEFGPFNYGSGSVRASLASGVPVIASRAKVFDDLGEAVYKPESIEEGLDDMRMWPLLRQAKINIARRYVHSRSAEAHADAHRELYRKVLGQ